MSCFVLVGWDWEIVLLCLCYPSGLIWKIIFPKVQHKQNLNRWWWPQNLQTASILHFLPLCALMHMVVEESSTIQQKVMPTLLLFPPEQQQPIWQNPCSTQGDFALTTSKRELFFYIQLAGSQSDMVVGAKGLKRSFFLRVHLSPFVCSELRTRAHGEEKQCLYMSLWKRGLIGSSLVTLLLPTYHKLSQLSLTSSSIRANWLYPTCLVRDYTGFVCLLPKDSFTLVASCKKSPFFCLAVKKKLNKHHLAIPFHRLWMLINHGQDFKRAFEDDNSAVFKQP